MHTIIYRKSDKLVAGVAYPRRTPESTSIAVTVEYQNIVNSELGGAIEDYASVEVADAYPAGKEPVISSTGVVSFQAPPKTSQDLARESRDAKLIALGLTQEELDA